MKYVLVIGDGMADTALAELNGQTPLEALDLPAFDRVAGLRCGRVRTVPQGLAPGSDTAILSIFGNDPRVCYTGRSVLEAEGMGVSLPEGGLSLRVNLCAVEMLNGQMVIHSHNGGNIHGDEAVALMNDLIAAPDFAAKMREMGLTIHVTDSFRHIGVVMSAARDLTAVRLTEPHNVLEQPIAPYLPHMVAETQDVAAKKLAEDIRELMLISYDVLLDHPINRRRIAQGQLPANLIWPWGAATAMRLESFSEKYHKQGTVVSAVPLVWGIARLGGLKTPHVEGANGDLDTNYQGKAERALQALFTEGDDFAAVHVEAPDEMAHAGSLEKKMLAIRRVNDLVVQPILDRLAERGEPFRMLLLSDHPTLLTTRTHDGAPVPYALLDSRDAAREAADGKPAPARKFCERTVANEPILEDGTALMAMLFEQA
ncbi:MAG TPA: 2,3-bisphosphoglycerate-independent phosphoglycerate mutase [Candidatus Limiplasma sp.]|nr:2,3-bisphosphoglycerate-independent phosphoglycerate mutase [Candidatus Limiplasma sp.]HPS81498.1 2,3-bisphosphoglycerate-independent phosphoglycerate mutase [Candidatus Limiplasma sp.]